MSRPVGDELLVRRAARRFAVQTAAFTATAMVLLVVLVTVVVVRGQDAATDRLLRNTAATADDVRDPPAGAWIVLEESGTLATTPRFPTELAAEAARLRADSTTHGQLQTLGGDDATYRVLTERRGEDLVQVVLDLGPQRSDRNRLLRTMTVAGLLSLLVAAGLGALLGRRAVRPLAEALTMQRGFVADASHELRTPLTLLSTRVQVLDTELQRATVDEQVLADSRGVVNDVQRLGEVVEDLLVAADPQRMEQHTLVDVGELVRAVVQSATAHARSGDVTLVDETDDGKQFPVRGAPAALRRAVLALVDNAIDHTPAAGEVTLEVTRERGDVVVSVRDTGPGIAAEAAAHVMRRFHSGGQRSGRAHYGLGLALTNDVANRHGGQLRLTPSATGTAFELVLPAAN